MKKKIYLFSKLVLLTTLISLIFSCEKDLYEDTIQQNQDKQINIKQISLEQFNSKLIQMKHKPEIEGFMVSSNSNSFQNRASSGSEFEIITDDIKEITQGDYTSYTMYVKTPDTTNSIYNITIEEVNDNTSVFLTKYEPSNNWTITSNRNFEGNIITYRISGITNDPVVLTSLLTEAFEGLQEGGNNGVGAGSGGSSTSNSYPYDCNGIVQTTIIVEAIMCSEFVHWPWSPTESNCTADEKAKIVTTYLYECIPTDYTPVDGDTPNPVDTPGGGTNTGNNNTGDTSLTTIVNPIGEECNAPRGDLNNDCMLDENEANFVTFLDNLTTQERQLIIGNNATKMNFFNYLVNQNWSNESKQFVEELIDLAIENNIEFIGNYQGNYSIFNNLSEVENFSSYEEVDNTISNSTNFQQIKKICNRTVKLNPLVDLLIELVITPNPSFSIDYENSNTDIETLLPGNEWVQQSITITGGDNNVAEVTISGYILVGIQIGDFKKGIKIRKHIIIRINKNNGSIYYSEVKNI